MPKRSWTALVNKIGNGECRDGIVASKLPGKGIHRSDSGQHLPTLYQLFIEWCKKNLSGDWGAESQVIKGRRAFRILLKSPEDAALLDKRFGAIAHNRASPPCAIQKTLKFQDSDYGKLAKELGYKVSLKT